MACRVSSWENSRSTLSYTCSVGNGMSTKAPLNGKDALHPPAHDVRKREQPQRLSSRRGVDDDDVVLARLAVAVDPQKIGQLVHAGQDSQLVGHQTVDFT